jgi:hypothetical protein
MRGLPIRLGSLPVRIASVLFTLAVVSQAALPPYLEGRVANRLTAHGGHAQVELSAIPAARLLFDEGQALRIRARGLSVDLPRGREDVFKRLDGFGKATIAVSDSRAGPFTVRSFWLNRRADGLYDVILSADATAADVANYAGAQLAGGFGQALAGLAANALSAFTRPIPVNVRMQIDASQSPPRATQVLGDVAGLPAGPLAQVVANALLGAL